MIPSRPASLDVWLPRLAVGLLAMAFITGGGSMDRGWGDVATQLLALPVIVLAVMRLLQPPVARSRWIVLAIAALGPATVAGRPAKHSDFPFEQYGIQCREYQFFTADQACRDLKADGVSATTVTDTVRAALQALNIFQRTTIRFLQYIPNAFDAALDAQYLQCILEGSLRTKYGNRCGSHHRCRRKHGLQFLRTRLKKLCSRSKPDELWCPEALTGLTNSCCGIRIPAFANLIFHFIATFLLCRKTPSACYLFSGVGAATSGFCVLIAIFHHFFTR